MPPAHRSDHDLWTTGITAENSGAAHRGRLPECQPEEPATAKKRRNGDGEKPIEEGPAAECDEVEGGGVIRSLLTQLATCVIGVIASPQGTEQRHGT